MTTLPNSMTSAEKKTLPLFRKDLVLYPGPPEPDGSPTYNLYDPVRGQFFKLNWSSYLVYKNLEPDISIQQLISKIEAQTTLKVSNDEIELLFSDANANNLLVMNHSSKWVIGEAEKLKVGWFMWLIYNYLYIRIPLANPNKFLEETLYLVKPLFSHIARKIYILITIIGLVLLTSRFDEFLNTFTYFFTFQGLLIYGIAITAIKFIHEFAHAYTAKYYKTYVPSIGIALIVFWPVLYTDVTDSWRLSSRKQRLAISAAGIISELILAGLSTLGWVLSPPGVWQSLFFVVASVTWISTLLVNLNPALRFDGYYLLSDLWGIDNLQSRTFAVTRWKLREWFLGIKRPPPEDFLTSKRIAGMVVYSIYTWIYRVVLYTTIAIFVYQHFTKLIGIFLFILEIGIFLVWPIVYEMQQLYRLRSYITFNMRTITTSLIVILFLIWFIVPLPHTETFSGLTISNPDQSQVIYAPFDSSIEKIYVKRGDKVEVGDSIVKLYSENLLANIIQAKLDLEIAENEILVASKSEENRPQISEKEANRNSLREKIKGFEELNNRLHIKSNVKGTLYSWDNTLQVGQYVSQNQVLGNIADLKKVFAVAYIPEEYIGDLDENQLVDFQLNSNFEKIKSKIVKIFPLRAKDLVYNQLASVNHGDLPVVLDSNTGKLILVESYYMVIIELDETTFPLRLGERGVLHAKGEWRSKFMTILRYLSSLLWREGTP